LIHSLENFKNGIHELRKQKGYGRRFWRRPTDFLKGARFEHKQRTDWSQFG
jgi:hypothetical protein